MNSTKTPSWNSTLFTTLALEVAITTFVDGLNASTIDNFGALLDHVNLVHVWGAYREPNSVAEAAPPCTVPAYQSATNNQGVVIDTKKIFSNPGTAGIRGVSVHHWAWRRAHGGGDGSLYVQVWGQSRKTRAADG
ncbi:hypothetical protein DYB26_015120 [Aphanomyces astaci]|uniref:Uncharacterized protein n=1 Tax=Aphanomyces astaci TaxID=112090 RepID=A0A397EHR9_APHAT|nr:hypothetical protein DYB34_012069 [Aphanomyces astaci]RHY78660.1 hypothetical protein DYB31_016585 [Aphanomyces astaci]RHZ31388.1 hypothetical protein DYB26_015120 [Aphanomyces astaci]